MKKTLVILSALSLAVTACQSWDNDEDTTVMEPAGAQSQSSDVNQSSSSRNVGQSGATTNEFDAPADDTGTQNQNQAPQNNDNNIDNTSPQSTP